MDRFLTQSTPKAPLRVSCAFLALWILILSLASVSPALHTWLHADVDSASGCTHQCSGHSEQESEEGAAKPHLCGVIALQDAFASVDAIVAPERTHYTRTHFESTGERLSSQAPNLYVQARAPPIEILV